LADRDAVGPLDTEAGHGFGAETNERRITVKQKRVGSSFDSWLHQEGICEARRTPQKAAAAIGCEIRLELI